MSLAELTAGADQIVVGNVRGVHSAWDARMRTIVSTVDRTWTKSGRARSRVLG